MNLPKMKFEINIISSQKSVCAVGVSSIPHNVRCTRKILSIEVWLSINISVLANNSRDSMFTAHSAVMLS